MADFTIEVTLDASGVKSGVAETRSVLSSLTTTDLKALDARLKQVGSSMQAFGGSLRQFGTSLSLAVTAPIAAIGASVLKAGGEYEKALNYFQAVTKASAAEMDRAAQVAKDLGADLTLPATSAKDAALAMTELGKAGLTAAQAMDAAKGVLQLAAAGQIDEARAAEVAANALNSFKLAASEATRVADLLAAAANASSAEVNDIALAMQQASAVAAGAKIPIEDLTTAIALMANAGIKGSDAGTSLKTFIQRLSAPTSEAAKAIANLGVQIFDASGKMRDLPDIIGQFERSLAGLTDQEKAQALNKIFGSDAIRAAQVLFREGAEGFDKIKAAVTAQGAAAELANAQMKGLAGAWEGFKSQLETIGIQIYEVIKTPLTDFLRTAADLAGRLGDAFSQMPEGLQVAVIAFTALAAAAGPVIFIVGTIVSAIGSLLASASTIGIVALAIAGIGQALAPVLVWVAALYAAWQTNFGGIRELTATVVAAIESAWASMKAAVTQLTAELMVQLKTFWEENGADIMKAVSTVSEFIKSVWQAVLAFWQEHGETIKSVTLAIWEAVKGIIKTALDAVLNAIKLVTAIINGDWSKAWEAFKGIAKDAWAAIVVLIRAQGEIVKAAVKGIISGLLALNVWILEQCAALGRAVIDGLINGVMSGTGRVAGAVWDLGKRLVKNLKDSVESKSPSKATFRVGTDITQGLANGINTGGQQVGNAAVGLGNTVLKGLKTLVGGDLQGFLTSVFDIMTDRTKSFGDKLRSLFGMILNNWQQMLRGIVASWGRAMGGDTVSGGSGGFGIGGGFGGGFGGGSGSGSFGVLRWPGDRTGTLDADGNYIVDGRSRWQQLIGKGGIFGSEGFGNNVGTYGAFGAMAGMVGGMIGGRVGGFISGAGAGLSMGAMIGSMIAPGIGTAIGAVVGAIGGGLISLFGGDPKRKKDKKENIPALQKGFQQAIADLERLKNDRMAIYNDPDGTLSRARDIRAQIAAGFGIEFLSKKYQKVARQQIAQKLIEADKLIAELTEIAGTYKYAHQIDERLVTSFAGGVFMSTAFLQQYGDFKRRNGFLGGRYTGVDNLPAMLGAGEMVLNPYQISRVKANAGMDPFARAGIPGYATGAMASSSSSSPMSMSSLAPTVVVSPRIEITIEGDGIPAAKIKQVVVDGMNDTDFQVKLAKATSRGGQFKPRSY